MAGPEGNSRRVGWRAAPGSSAAPLSSSRRAVTESINQLITLCTQQAPGQKECDNALRELEVSPWPQLYPSRQFCGVGEWGPRGCSS